MLSNLLLDYLEEDVLVFDPDYALLLMIVEIVHPILYLLMSSIFDHDVNLIDFYDHVHDYEKN
jgi:hypothetical protein